MELHSGYREKIDFMWESSSEDERRYYMGGVPAFDPNQACIESYCRPDKFKETVANLTTFQRECVEAIGLDSLLDISCSFLCRGLVEEVVNLIDPTCGSVTLHGRDFYFTDEIFGELMGLNYGKGNMYDRYHIRQHVEEQLELIAPKGGDIHIDKLQHWILHSREGGDAFKIIFALYAYGTLLYPSVSGNVDRGIMIQLQDTSRIWRIKWASSSISHLMNGVIMYKSNPSLHFAGSLVYLQLYYCQVLGTKLAYPTYGIPPYIYWTVERIRDLIRWVCNHGGFRCKLILDFSHDEVVPKQLYMCVVAVMDRMIAEKDSTKDGNLFCEMKRKMRKPNRLSAEYGVSKTNDDSLELIRENRPEFSISESNKLMRRVPIEYSCPWCSYLHISDTSFPSRSSSVT